MGVVLCCPALGYFGHRTNTNQFERIDRFFDHLNPALVRQAAFEEAVDDYLLTCQQLRPADNSRLGR